MGADGLTRATQVAILAPTTSPRGSAPHYPVLYTGRGGLVAHECIVDLRPITKETGVTVDDVAKRLIDYGFHAPTMSFPVAGTLMIEPTESEDLAELDRFCDAMIAIREEIDAGRRRASCDRDDNPLRNAPHTAAALAADVDAPLQPRGGGLPGGVAAATKYWPPVRRIDGAYGDRNLVCSCPPVSELRQRLRRSRQGSGGGVVSVDVGRAGAGWMTRPSGSSSPVSSKSRTPLHSRLQPCSGWQATVWAASRSGPRRWGTAAGAGTWERLSCCGTYGWSDLRHSNSPHKCRPVQPTTGRVTRMRCGNDSNGWCTWAV